MLLLGKITLGRPCLAGSMPFVFFRQLIPIAAAGFGELSISRVLIFLMEVR